jgi:hypothetical protein
MQPPSSSRTYWDATVKKMKKPFGAPFPDEDIGEMVDYLVKTYGAERTTTPASGRGARRDLPPKGGSHAMLSWDSWLPASAGQSGRR